MNKLNTILITILAVCYAKAGQLDDLVREILANEYLLIYQMENREVDNDLAAYNKVLKRVLKEKCTANPKSCLHFDLRLKETILEKNVSKREKVNK